MTKQLGMIALGLVLTLGTATASWAGNEAAAKQKTGSEAAPAGSNWSPLSNEPDRCFAPSPWGYQWVCGSA